MTLPMQSLSVERHPPPWVLWLLLLLVMAVIGAMSEAQEVESPLLPAGANAFLPGQVGSLQQHPVGQC